MAESNLLLGDISYAHFCHRAFLKEHWGATRQPGLRAFFKWLDHWLHARLESYVFRRVNTVVAPSRGLATELSRYFPELAGRVRVISNPINVQEMLPPAKYERQDLRRQLRIEQQEIALIFCALGHFERKGLGLLLDVLETLPQFPWRLVVVGGQPTALKPYKTRGCGRVIFTGIQKDVRPFLWAADAFVLPSVYETFSLVAFEAAAAGLPLLVSKLYGVEEILCDGRNGILLPRERPALLAALMRFFRCSSVERAEMGAQAQLHVRSYTPATFVANWRKLYEDIDLQVYPRRLAKAGHAAV